MLQQVALVAKTDKLAREDLLEVSAAIQKQVSRDFGPMWGIEATVDPFLALKDVPADYAKVTVEDFADMGGDTGVHLTRDGQPYARVALTNAWSLTASHEILEILADPSLNEWRAGGAIDDSGRRVQYLVEVCDPCQAPEHGYTVNGVLVSDFVAPWYYDPVSVPGIAYSFAGNLSAPRQLAVGGYLTWFDPIAQAWRQATNVSGQVTVGNLTVPPTSLRPLRERIDLATRPPEWWTRGIDYAQVQGRLRDLVQARSAAQEAHCACAAAWEREVYGERPKPPAGGPAPGRYAKALKKTPARRPRGPHRHGG